MMFRKKLKQTNKRITDLQVWVRDLDMAISQLKRGMSVVDEQYSTMRSIKADMAKMDVLTSMISELARRVDLAGIEDLPSECKCEACGCNNIMVAMPRAVRYAGYPINKDDNGFEIDKNNINPILYDFQKDIVHWSIKKGKSAIFAGTGLGKTFCQVE